MHNVLTIAAGCYGDGSGLPDGGETQFQSAGRATAVLDDDTIRVGGERVDVVSTLRQMARAATMLADSFEHGSQEGGAV